MSVKKFLLLSFLIFIFIFPSVGEEKQKPLPLAELQNPKGPSYVPIPYPQTREEILVDLEHIIEKFFVARKEVRLYGKSSVRDNRISRLFKEDSELHIGKIVNVTNKTYRRAEKFILIDIHDSSNNVAIRIGLEDSGLFSKARFVCENCKIIPLMSISEVRDLFTSSRQTNLKDTKIESIEYEHYHFCSITSPFLKIKTPDKIFYMSSKNTIYEVQEREEFTSLSSFMLSYKKERDSIYKENLNTHLVDTQNNKITYLKKVK